MGSLKKVAALMHVTALRQGTAFREWDGLKLKLYYRECDIVLCLWKTNGIPTENEAYITKLNFFAANTEVMEARRGQRVWMKIERCRRNYV